jgi:hypothetical protein
MDTVSVSCNSCGAPLRVGTQVRFVTCQFCNTQLEIKRSDSSIFTEQIDRIADNTAQMAQDLEAIKLQNEIEMLDREAAACPDQSSRNGGPGGRGGGLFGLAFAIFFAFVCFGMAGIAGKSRAPGFFALVPIGMGIFVVVGALMTMLKSSDRSERQDNLRRRRDELTQKLAELNKPPRT